jgi:hypothetical protein
LIAGLLPFPFPLTMRKLAAIMPFSSFPLLILLEHKLIARSMLLIVIEPSSIPNPFYLILQHLFDLSVQFPLPVIIPLIKLSIIDIGLTLTLAFQQPHSMRYSVLNLPMILRLLPEIIVIKKRLCSYIEEGNVFDGFGFPGLIDLRNKRRRRANTSNNTDTLD